MKRHLILATLFLSLAIVFYDWLSSIDFDQGSMEYIRSLNHLASLFGFVLMFYLFVFSSKMSFFEKKVGLDKMLQWHRRVGVFAVSLLALHPLLLFIFEVSQYDQWRMMWARWVGVAALGIVVLTAVTAMHFKKLKMRYEVWKAIHFINYAAFPLALVHVFFNSSADRFSHYVWISFSFCFAFIAGGKVLSFFRIRRNPYTLVNKRKENEEVWSLEFEGKSIHFLPGQFMQVHFKSRHGALQSHPFTISSSPTSSRIAITPKVLGDFTSQIEGMRIGETAYIDAPYGVFSPLLEPADALVFVAGGIGITPFISMLRYMKDVRDLEKRIILFWGNQSDKDLVFENELERYESEFRFFRKVLVMSDQEDWSGEQGFIDKDILQKYLEPSIPYKFFICGPPPLQKLVKDELLQLGVKRKHIKRELFDF